MDIKTEILNADVLLSEIFVHKDDTYKMVSARKALKRVYDSLIKQEVQDAAGTTGKKN